MYDYGDSWTTKFLLLTGEFAPLGCFALVFACGAITALIGIGAWNWLTR